MAVRMIKPCAECKWCKVPENHIIKLVQTEYWCFHPKLVTGEVNIVTGRPYLRNCYELRRMSKNECGEDGNLWEPK